MAPCSNFLISIHRVGQNRTYTPYTVVYLVVSLQKKTYVHQIYMVLTNPEHTAKLTVMVCEKVERTIVALPAQGSISSELTSAGLEGSTEILTPVCESLCK